MAGMGAYGGAGLATGLMGAGGAAAGAAGAGSVTPVAAAGAGAGAGAGATLGGSIMAGAPGTTSVAASGLPSTLGSGFMNTAPSIVANPATAQLTAANQALQVPATQTAGQNLTSIGQGAKTGIDSLAGVKSVFNAMPTGSASALGMSAMNAMQPEPPKPIKDYSMIRPYTFESQQNPEAYDYQENNPNDSSERNYFTNTYTALEPYKAPGPEYGKAAGGLTSFAIGGPVEQMSAQNALGNNAMYPQSQIQAPMYSNPMAQRPMPSPVVTAGGDAAVDPYTGEQKFAKGGKTTGEYKYDFDPKTQQFTQTAAPVPVRLDGLFNSVASHAAAPAPAPAKPFVPVVSGGIQQPINSYSAPRQSNEQIAAPINIPAYQTPEQQLGLEDFYARMNQRLGQMGGQGYAAGGGVSSLGSYSDGGRMLKGPGDGMSDSIPAQIGEHQPARLADSEFVIPADVVSHLGNGSTDAGAKQLYAMMDRVRKARTGTKKQGKQINPTKFMPA